MSSSTPPQPPSPRGKPKTSPKRLVARVAALIKKLTRPAPIRSTIMEDVKFDFRKLADPGVSWRLAPAG